MLNDGETGPDAAKAAVARMTERIAQLTELAHRLRSAKPPATKAAPKTAKKKVAKKAAARKKNLTQKKPNPRKIKPHKPAPKKK